MKIFAGSEWCLCNEKMEQSSTLEQEEQRRTAACLWDWSSPLTPQSEVRSMPNNMRCFPFVVIIIYRCLIFAGFLPWNFLTAQQEWKFGDSPKKVLKMHQKLESAAGLQGVVSADSVGNKS